MPPYQELRLKVVLVKVPCQQYKAFSCQAGRRMQTNKVTRYLACCANVLCMCQHQSGSNPVEGHKCTLLPSAFTPTSLRSVFNVPSFSDESSVLPRTLFSLKHPQCSSNMFYVSEAHISSTSHFSKSKNSTFVEHYNSNTRKVGKHPDNNV